MENSELTLYVHGDGSIHAQREDGTQEAGSLEKHRLHEKLIELFDDWLRQDKIRERRELETFGSLLYAMLFSGRIGSFFERSLRDVADRRRLRVQLSFAEGVAALAGMPWEYLYYPETDTAAGFFLSTHVRLVLSRYLPLRERRLTTLRPESGPLRLLVVLSGPEGLKPVLGEPVIEAISKLPKTLPLQVDVLREPTMENLLAALESARPQALHFIGHARFQRSEGRGEIALLAHDRRSAAWYPDHTLAESFAQQTGAATRLVLLHACEGAAVDLGRSFSGLAPRLVREGIQAVVAMQYEITNRAAILFSRSFYKELAQAQPVDDATQKARWQLAVQGPRGYNDRTFGTPVLYMRSRDGVILPVASARSMPV